MIIHVEKPVLTAKELADQIFHIIQDNSNAYFKIHEISTLLNQHNFYAADETKREKTDCFGE